MNVIISYFLIRNSASLTNSLSLLGHQIPWPSGTIQELFLIHDYWTFQTPMSMVNSHSSLVTMTPFVRMHPLSWSQRLFCRVPHWELSQFHLEINHLSHQIHNEPTKCLQVLLFITQWALKDVIESFINHKLEQLSCFQNRIPNKGNPVLYYRQELQISQASEVLFQPPSWFPFHMTREVPWNYYLKLLSLK